jgi:hypothetical protein
MGVSYTTTRYPCLYSLEELNIPTRYIVQNITVLNSCCVHPLIFYKLP